MGRTFLLVAILALALVACGKESKSPTAAPTLAPTETASATAAPTPTATEPSASATPAASLQDSPSSGPSTESIGVHGRITITITGP